MALLGVLASTSSSTSAELDARSRSSSPASMLDSKPQHAAAGPSNLDEMLDDCGGASPAQHSWQQHSGGTTFAQSASAPGWEDDDSMEEATPRPSELAALPPPQAAIAESVLTLLEGAGANLHRLVSYPLACDWCCVACRMASFVDSGSFSKTAPHIACQLYCCVCGGYG